MSRPKIIEASELMRNGRMGVREQREEQNEAKQLASAQIAAAAEGTRDEALARAAREGYRVEGAYLDHIAKNIAGAAGFWYREDSPAAKEYEFEDRRTPSAEAFETIDRVWATVKAMREPDCINIEVGRVLQFRQSRLEPFRQVVVVRIATKWWPTRIVLLGVGMPAKSPDVIDARLWRAFRDGVQRGIVEVTSNSKPLDFEHLERNLRKKANL